MIQRALSLDLVVAATDRNYPPRINANAQRPERRPRGPPQCLVIDDDLGDPDRLAES